MPSTVEDRLARYEAWRRREPVERPMIGLLWEPDVSPLEEFVGSLGASAVLPAGRVEPDRLLAHFERWHRRAGELPGDVIQRLTPAVGIPWIEAIAGCPVAIHPGSLWAEPCLDDYTHRPTIRLDPQNPWFRKLIEFTKALVALADGRFPIATPQLRGPLDTLAAMRTPEQLCLDLMERPDDVVVILDELADVWIAVAQAALDVIPPFHGGYMARMGTWAPGTIATMQNDVSTLLSPGMYRRLVLPHDRKIASRFAYTEFHMHGSEHHQIGNLLELERLTTIQLTLEHTLGGPPLDAMLVAAKKILAVKPLLLAALDVDSAEHCLTELPSTGLCLMLAVGGEEIPSEFRRWIARKCR